MSSRKHFPANPADSNSNQRLLTHLHSEFEKVFQRTRSTMPEFASQSEVSSQPTERVSLNLFETDKGVDIECDLSSFDGEDITVSARKNCLIIEAIFKETSDMSFYLGDPSAENFRKVIPLGFAIGRHSFRTQRRNGMLVVHVDKPTVGMGNRKETIEA